MELMTMNSLLQPEDLIENYESLIWTERYSSEGDWELKSTDIASIIAALPRESFVCLRESTVPMVVENHEIKKPARQAPYITVTGRSFETVLERRASVKDNVAAGAGRTTWTIAAAKESDAAYLAMRTVLGDFPRYQAGSEVLTLVNPVNPLDAIPEIDLVLPADYSNTSPNTYEIQPKDLYSAVLELIQTNNRGLKAIRPNPGASQIGVEIYNGADLTSELVFDARFDQYEDATYLLSQRGSTNVGYVFGGAGSLVVKKNEAAPEPSGLARRVLLVDESNEASINTAAIRKSRGLIELYKYNATALFDGEIAEQVAAGYNTRYHLGDILKLTGEYGLSQDVRVAEYIRSSDATGEKAYPAFQAVS